VDDGERGKGPEISFAFHSIGRVTGLLKCPIRPGSDRRIGEVLFCRHTRRNPKTLGLSEQGFCGGPLLVSDNRIFDSVQVLEFQHKLCSLVDQDVLERRLSAAEMRKFEILKDAHEICSDIPRQQLMVVQYLLDEGRNIIDFISLPDCPPPQG
jgi:hypothetical protein